MHAGVVDQDLDRAVGEQVARSQSATAPRRSGRRPRRSRGRPAATSAAASCCARPVGDGACTITCRPLARERAADGRADPAAAARSPTPASATRRCTLMAGTRPSAGLARDRSRRREPRSCSCRPRPRAARRVARIDQRAAACAPLPSSISFSLASMPERGWSAESSKRTVYRSGLRGVLHRSDRRHDPRAAQRMIRVWRGCHDRRCSPRPTPTRNRAGTWRPACGTRLSICNVIQHRDDSADRSRHRRCMTQTQLVRPARLLQQGERDEAQRAPIAAPRRRAATAGGASSNAASVCRRSSSNVAKGA